ncbi:hypothetical protein Aperf_G00000049778 [Anoplocephala perfoliata]
MDVEESCKQLSQKIEVLGFQSDVQATKSISKLLQRLRDLLPGFVIPDNLEFLKPVSVISSDVERKTRASNRGNRSIGNRSKAKRRKRSDSQANSDSVSVQTRASKLGNQSIGSRSKAKRRKLSNSQASSDSVSVQSLVTTDMEMPTISEVIDLTVSPALGITYIRTSKSASRSVPQENAAQSTLSANTAESLHSISQSAAEGATVSTPPGPISKEIQPSPPTENGCFGSCSEHKSESLRMSTVNDNSLKSSELTLKGQASQNIEGPQPVENCVEQPGNSACQIVNSDIMTEESEEAIEQLPLTTEVAKEVLPTPAGNSDPLKSPEVVPPQTAAVSKSAFVKSILPVVASTPNAEQQNTPWLLSSSKWLYRLGWGTAPKASAATVKDSHHIQTVSVMGKIKNGLLTNTVSKTAGAPPGRKVIKPVTKVCGVVGSVPRQSRLNNPAGASKANCCSVASKTFGGPGPTYRTSAAHHTATSGVRLGPSTLALPKEQAEDERRKRLLAEIAEREQRWREALERRALEHKAKVKAANERRAAVRANAEALAKKQEAEKLRKLLALKDKPLPSKPPISGAHRVSHTVKHHQPLGTISTNVVTATPHVPSAATNYMENFDLIKVPPPQPKTQVHDAPESPISYDLTGILDEYNSDSDDDNHAKKRHIPSWARPGSQFLVERMSKAYQGELRWQDIFRPAETIQFDDADLFRGYKFRTRPRGSSAVWTSPSDRQPSNESHNVSRL